MNPNEQVNKSSLEEEVKEVRETNWATQRKTIHPSFKTKAVRTLLKAGGAVCTYYLCRTLGEGIDHIPDVNQIIPHMVNYVSGLDIQGHIDGLTGLLGGIYGWRHSGMNLDSDTLKPKRYVLQPLIFDIGCTPEEKNEK